MSRPGSISTEAFYSDYFLDSKNSPRFFSIYFGWRSGARAHDQFGRKTLGLGRFAMEQFLHHFHGRDAQPVLWLPNGRQGNRTVLANKNIPKSANRNLFRNLDALGGKQRESANGNQV